MKSLFITIIILLINYSFCCNDKDKYLELKKSFKNHILNFY